VFLADDYLSLHNALTRLLTSSYDVVGRASDGLEAVEEARRLRPDVVVLDVLMPGMNGLDACREIKSAAPGAHVIVITAADDEDPCTSGTRSGRGSFDPEVSGSHEALTGLPATSGRSGTAARTVVPIPCFDSMTSCPFTILIRSCMLANPSSAVATAAALSKPRP
jgi:CheY-like chemotaxis protein